MSWILELYRSAMGKKAVMAVTGLLLFGFVVGHMVGNLKLYLGVYESGPHAGAYKIDVYGEGLREIGAPILGHGQALWIARLVLLAAVLIHIHAATSLTLLSRRARPVAYAQKTPQAADYASRTMRWGGVIILLFVVYHLLHLTFGSVHPHFAPGRVHDNVVYGFRNPWVSGFYIAAQIALGFHLYHGLWSLFQSLGLSGPRLDAFRRQFAAAFAVLISVGNISFPVAVLTGLVPLGG